MVLSLRNPYNSLSDERCRTAKPLGLSATQELISRSESNCGPSTGICAKLVTMRGGRKEGDWHLLCDSTRRMQRRLKLS